MFDRLIEAGRMLILLCVFNPACLFAQHSDEYSQAGRWYVRNVGPEDYNSHSQIWSFTEGLDGRIYVGTSTDLLEYDGTTWRRIESPNSSVVRSLDVDAKGRVYAGLNGDFGFLAPDSSGSLRFVTLLDRLASEDLDFNDVWNTQVSREGVYFHSYERLFRFTGKNIKVWRRATNFNSLHQVRDTMYVAIQDVGLMRVQDNALVNVEWGGMVADERLVGLYPVGDAAVLAITRSKGILFCPSFSAQATRCRPLHPEWTDTLTAMRPYRSAMLGDGSIVIGTMGSGAVLIDAGGNVLRVLDESAGLRNEIVWFPFVTGDGNLWLGLNDGLARVRVGTSVTFFDKTAGLNGTVNDLIRHEGMLYAATDRGIFELTASVGYEQAQFSVRTDAPKQCWSFLAVSTTLLSGCAERIYDLERKRRIASFVSNHAFAMHHSSADANRVYVGLNDGLALLEFQDEEWRLVDRLQLAAAIRTFEEADDGVLWMGTTSDGVFSLDSAAALTANHIRRYDQEHGLPEGWINVTKRAGEVLFVAEINSATYRVDSNAGAVRFVRDDKIDQSLPEYAEGVSDFVEDEQGRVWTFAGKASGVAIPQLDGSYDYRSSNLRLTPIRSAYVMHSDAGGPIWIGGPHGIVRLEKDERNEDRGDYVARVRRVSALPDSSLFGGDRPAGFEKPVWPFEIQSLRFAYAAPGADEPSLTMYRTQLEGFEAGWSPWSRETQKDYTNLSEGIYTFKVQARDVHGMLSAEDRFAFEILPPWYRTGWAYLIWFLLGGLIVGSMIIGYNRMQTGRLQARNRILERRVADRTEEIVKQKAAIEEAYEELSWTNEDLIQSHHALEDRTNQLQEALEVNKEILGITAHDLKNPLSGIIGLLDMVLTDARKNQSSAYESIEENLPLAKDEAERMLQIVKDLLDKHRQGEQIALRKERIILGDMVSTVLRWNRNQAGYKSIELHYDTAATYVVDVDVSSIQRVLDNYLSNAIKYSPTNTNVWVTTEISTESEGDGQPMVLVSVRDEGPGLTDEDLQKVFGKMQQLSAKPTAGEHSTGLGLYIVKQLIEAHEGEVGVYSIHGEGATFWFTLPVLSDVYVDVEW